jgi:hypothetical protein
MSGYVDCACRDCFEIALGEAGTALCSECQEAGCTPNDGECLAPGAYGVEDPPWVRPPAAPEDLGRKLEGEQVRPFAQALQDIAQALQEGRAELPLVVLGPRGSFKAVVHLRGEYLYLDAEGQRALVLTGPFTMEVKPL